MKINVIGEQLSQEEIDAYVKHANEKYPDKVISELTITVDGEFADLKYEFEDIPFERIRRITGYLVGTLDRFNDGKRAEENDRVKHSI
ncbi:MAG: anaerobic ribonucleoside-triphosphate reductase [Ruminococcus sp.]